MNESTSVEEKVFKCIRCGCCCKNIKYYEPASFLDNGSGVCKYYDDTNKACIIYDHRPEFCRVDKMYKLYRDKMSWNEYVDSNVEACEELRRLEKAKHLNEMYPEKLRPFDENGETVLEEDENNKELEEYLFDDDEDFFG